MPQRATHTIEVPAVHPAHTTVVAPAALDTFMTLSAQVELVQFKVLNPVYQLVAATRCDALNSQLRRLAGRRPL